MFSTKKEPAQLHDGSYDVLFQSAVSANGKPISLSSSLVNKTNPNSQPFMPKKHPISTQLATAHLFPPESLTMCDDIQNQAHYSKMPAFFVGIVT